jgi:hypothetical protein
MVEPAPGSICLGVDLAAEDALTVLATRRRGGVQFTPATSRPGAHDPVAAALPAHTAFVRRLRAPFASLAKAEKVWPSLLDIELPFPLDSAVYVFLNSARTADGQTETLAVAARRADVEAWQARLDQAGWRPWYLDHEGLALWSRSVAEQPLAKPGARMVCYVGHDRTALAWGRGSELHAASGLRLGAHELTDPERGPAALRNWAQRINSFRRAQAMIAGESVQWAWCGPGVTRPDRLAALAAALDLSADIKSFTHREPDTFLARAVAARALVPESSTCSLLPDDRVPPMLARLRSRRARRAPLALAAAALLLLGVNVGWTTWLNHRRDQLQEAVQQRAVELSGTTQLPRGQEVLVTERALAEQAPTLVPFRQAFTPSLLSVANLLLSQAARHGMTLESVTLSEHNVTCRGTVVDWNHGEALAAALSLAGWLPEVERREAAASERVAFTLKASR